MNIRADFVNYIDQNGLLAPNPLPIGTIKGSDNSVMYTSEFYIILQKLGQLTEQDKLDYAQKINKCIGSNLLNRAPIGQNDGQEGPDDLYGVLDACKQLNNIEIPRKLLWGAIKYLGALNNVTPGVWSWQSFLIRQPQLLTSMISAAFPSWKNPLHILTRVLCWPLYLAAAVSIFVSCIGAPSSDTDSRRLSWHLIQTTKDLSIMCKFASLFWYSRLYNTYGKKGMKGVASIYYHPQPDNPYAKYWVNE